jgi:hypothetical protein
VTFYGTIETGDGALVLEAMRAWVGEPLSVKPRDLGLEIVHDDERAGRSVYCHPAFAAGAAPLYLVEGSIAGPAEKAHALLLALVRLLAGRGVAGSFDYTEQDEQGRPIGDEVTVDGTSQ